ncbi:hypothetical protein BDB01DRAFT_798004 [Pilobolus umbonatus]|nr:hypothetical protein BDB01DRAFT_798004 [Pilobolus umbonatus]
MLKFRQLLIHNNSNNSNKQDSCKGMTTVVLDNKEKKKKRFSLLSKPSSPTDIQSTQLSKSTSFLHLKKTKSTESSMNRSRSMFGQLYSTDTDKHNVISSSNLSSSSPITLSISHYDSVFHTAAVSSTDSYYCEGNTLSHSSATKDQYLQLGMQYHEKGELEKATYYWKLSAENDSPLGLFLYGLALRHGWGCRKNPAIAVRHLQKAAECAVFDLQEGLSQSVTVTKSELVLAIYELGVCFRHGWGVPKNLTTAAYYFELAANLGDPDAMNDLAFCYTHGHGVKKDIHKAAKYYRMADNKGQGLVGNSWIWKEKYDHNN